MMHEKIIPSAKEYKKTFLHPLLQRSTTPGVRPMSVKCLDLLKQDGIGKPHDASKHTLESLKNYLIPYT